MMREERRFWWIVALMTAGSAIALWWHLDLHPGVIALLAINIAAMLLMTIDKSVAVTQRKGFRVPERIFFLLAAIGAAPGILLAARLARHKTKKRSFQLIVIAILFAQLILITTFFRRS